MVNPVENDLKKEREEFLLLAQIAMHCKDYRYMLDFMKKLIEIVMPTEDISEDERNYFSSACELFINGDIGPWRQLAFVAADVSRGNDWRDSAIEYQELIADEITKTCAEIAEFINRSVLCAGEGAAKEMTTESRVFYKMMRGEYLGHVAMVKKGLERVKYVEDVLEAYNAAMEEALELQETNQTRLKLALQVALFHAEICGSLHKACSVAKEAMDVAKRSLEIRGETIPSEIAGLLEELESNIKIWMAKIADNVTPQNSEDSSYQLCKTDEAEQEELNRA